MAPLESAHGAVLADLFPRRADPGVVRIALLVVVALCAACDEEDGPAAAPKDGGTTITVLAPDGTPVAGARFRVRRSHPEPRQGFAPHGGGFTHATDASGRVALRGLQPDVTYDLWVRPPRERPDLRAPEPLLDWTPHDATLRFQAWHSISGVVRDMDGHAVLHAMVSAVPTVPGDETLRHRKPTDEEGRFAFERVPDGGFALNVELLEGLLQGAVRKPALSPGQAVLAGATDVVLVVAVGKQLTVMLDVLEASAYSTRGLPGPLAMLWLETGSGVTESARAFVRDGVARFRGLRADETYSLWIAPTDDGSLVFQRGVRAGTLQARRSPGKTITVNVQAPASASKISASADGPFFTLAVRHLEQSSGPVVLSGIPEGTWRVSAHAQVGEEWWMGWGQVSAGSSADIEVKPPSDVRK